MNRDETAAAPDLPASRLWPRISVLLPVHDPALVDLERAIASVERQVWPVWELCVVDDGSRQPEVRACLDDLATRDSVRFVRHDEARGIAGATNAAIALATGDYLLLLDHDDELSDDAMGRLVQTVRAHPEADLVYSDHDVIDVDDRRIGIDLKPGWSPELLLSYMYLGHAKLLRKSLVRELGGYREGFEGAADYDFALRLAERHPRVVHVPGVLYHWRAAERSVARSTQLKRYAFESGRLALQSALERRGLAARAEWPGWARRAGVGVFRVRWSGLEEVSVAIVIRIDGAPGTGRERDCVESLRRSDGARARTVVTVDASLGTDALCEMLRTLEEDFVLFLDGDVLVSTPGFVEELLGFALLEGVGAVGAKIVGEDGRIRHAGTVLGIDGGTASAFAGREDLHWPLEHGFYAHTPRNCSAVSRCAMLVRRDRFLDVGGFDDRLEGQADTDLCLRLQDKGYRIVLDPYAEVVLPAEAELRGRATRTSASALRARWPQRLEGDPFYHPAFTRLRADFSPRTQLVERGSDGRPLTAAPHRVDDPALVEIVTAQAHRIETLETRLARLETAARILDGVLSSGPVRRVLGSRLGIRLRQRIRGTRLERRLKLLLGRAPI
jgi:GT2 family glycosyltransferase